jgi:hypothetical protein
MGLAISRRSSGTISYRCGNSWLCLVCAGRLSHVSKIKSNRHSPQRHPDFPLQAEGLPLEWTPIPHYPRTLSLCMLQSHHLRPGVLTKTHQYPQNHAYLPRAGRKVVTLPCTSAPNSLFSQSNSLLRPHDFPVPQPGFNARRHASSPK